LSWVAAFRMTGPPARVLVHVPARALEYAQALTSAVLRPAKIAAPCAIEVRVGVTAAEAQSLAPWPDIFFGAGLAPEVLLEMPRLGWIQWAWAGVDRLLDHRPFAEALAQSRFRLSRAVGLFGPPLAEYVLAYCLCLTQGIPQVLEAQRERAWRRFRPGRLAGKRLGVAGLGSTGGEIARQAARLGLEVWGCRRSGASPGPTPEGIARVFGPTQLDVFVSGLDFLVLALPLTPATRGLFSAGLLARMKPASVLINVGRGALVDERALVEALRAGRPGWAVLDVFEREPLPPESKLWSLPNVIITPHLAGLSRPDDIGDLFLHNLAAYRSGGPLAGEVRADLGY